MSAEQLAIALLAVNSAGTLSSTTHRKAAAEFNARMAERQAERERQIAESDANNYRRKQMKQLASARALRATSGVSMEGSPLLVEDTMIEDIEINAETIRRGGQAKAGDFVAQAQFDRMRGRNALTQDYFSAGKSLLSGLGDIRRKP